MILIRKPTRAVCSTVCPRSAIFDRRNATSRVAGTGRSKGKMVYEALVVAIARVLEGMIFNGNDLFDKDGNLLFSSPE